MNKENLIQNNTPALRFPPFTEGWVRKKLGDVAPLQRGFDLPVDKIIKGQYPVVFSNGILKFHNEFKAKAPGVVTGRSGTIGKVTFVEKDYWPHNTSLWVTNFMDNYPKFIFYFYSKYNLERFGTGSGVPTLNRNDVHSQEEYFPSNAEQQKIATFFTAIDKKLSGLKEKKNLLEQYKKGAMQKLFAIAETDVRPSVRFKNTEGGDFADWEEKNGNEIFESVSNKNHNSDLPILAITQEYGAIPRDMIDYQVSVTDKSVESYKVVEVGDYIISLRSFQGGIEYSNYKGICSPAYIILKPFMPIDRRFYKYYFKTEYYIKQLNRNLEGIRDGKMISYKYFSEIELPYPSLEEQTQIANFLNALDEKIQAVSTQMEKMERWKKGLLQQMFV